jgi:CubicO group peptidase (beta-lactamase class C family)
MSLSYPGSQWNLLENPEQEGWSMAHLQKAGAHAEELDSTSLMVVHKGKVVYEWGETDARSNTHSCRKSFLSALIGIYVHEGIIDLSSTLAELGIDDNEPSLSDVEKSATVENLLQARSGVYHPALYETEKMAEKRPPRGSHTPGSFWYYNNWDFNALGTIFHKLTGKDFFTDFKERIADPIGMQDFRIEDCQYVSGEDSIHNAYPFRLSARDMARIGLLFARNGNWNGQQVIPAEWVQRSTAVYSEVPFDEWDRGGYGYMWWVSVDGKGIRYVELPDGEVHYSARGFRGQYILVFPKRDLVVVHRVNSDYPGLEVEPSDFGELLADVIKAYPTRPTMKGAC